PLTRLIGREADLQAVLALLAPSRSSGRLVTLLGPGGIGKTRLALEVADQAAAGFPDGVWLAELGPLADPAALPLAVARALGIDVRNFAYRAAILLWLAPRRGLLLLDNCEHMPEAAAAMAEAILRACPQMAILATSREPLRAEGELHHRLAPLALAEPEEGADPAPEDFPASALFLERARAVIGPFTPDPAQARDILAICRSLDGLPLALELAAPLLQTQHPAQLRARLEQRLPPLAAGRRTAPARQQTLAATLDWSLALLAPAELALLRPLAAPRGSWSLEAALCLAGAAMAPDAVQAAVARLVDTSLVQADLARDPPRYRLLQATRSALLDRLPAGEAEGAQARLAEWLAGLCRRAAADWETMPDAAWHARYRPELDMLRGSLAWALEEAGDPAQGALLASLSETFWSEFASTGELTRWFDRALAILPPGALSPEVEARLLLGRSGWLAIGEAGAADAAGRAVALLQDAPSPLLGRALAQQALHRIMAGEAAGIGALLQQAAACFLGWADTKAPLGLRRVEALAMLRQGASEEARPLLAAAIQAAARLGAARDQALLLGDLAELEFLAGDIDQAAALVEQALSVLGPARSRSAWVQHLHGALASYSLMRGDVDGARRLSADRLYATRIMGMPREVAANLERAGLLAAREGKPRLGARLMGFAEARQDQAGHQRSPSSQAVHDRLLAEVSAALAPADLSALRAEGAGLSEEMAAAATA
ncbi:hypothetical protein BKE38_11685, partial [Pseudoroseomonas deserti]